MATTIEASVLVGASLATTWDCYFDARRWGAWVDGFQAPIEADGYPEEGGVLRWRSVPAGRGEVTERVAAHEPRRRHLVTFTDPGMEGELETSFSVEGDGTRVRQRMEYAVRDRGPIARLGALLFVRGQVRQSLQRSLLAFRRTAEEAESLPG